MLQQNRRSMQDQLKCAHLRNLTILSRCPFTLFSTIPDPVQPPPTIRIWPASSTTYCRLRHPWRGSASRNPAPAPLCPYTGAARTVGAGYRSATGTIPSTRRQSNPAADRPRERPAPSSWQRSQSQSQRGDTQATRASGAVQLRGGVRVRVREGRHRPHGRPAPSS